MTNLSDLLEVSTLEGVLRAEETRVSCCTVSDQNYFLGSRFPVEIRN